MTSKCQKLITFIENFMEDTNLFPSNGGCFWVAVSSGVDSMFLLYVLHEVAKKRGISLKAIHINHGTRKENIDEENLVKEFCKKLNIKLHIEKLNMSFKNSNFEKLARDKRYQIFSSLKTSADRLALGHHIDDSVEWSLSRFFKTSNENSFLGIPVYNNGYIRPLMCMSKEQISYWSNQISIPYAEDSSNSNTRYERNYLRMLIRDKFKSNYPSYLKHYVMRHNRLAAKLGHSRLESKLSNTRKIFKKDCVGNYYCIVEDGEILKSSLWHEQLINIVNRINKQGRGQYQKELNKLYQAYSNGKQGPFLFGKNCEVYLFKNLVMIMTDIGKFHWNNKASQITGHVSSIEQIPAPFWVRLPVTAKSSGRKRHSFFQNIIDKYTRENFCLQTFHSIDSKSQCQQSVNSYEYVTLKLNS